MEHVRSILHPVMQCRGYRSTWTKVSTRSSCLGGLKFNRRVTFEATYGRVRGQRFTDSARDRLLATPIFTYIASHLDPVRLGSGLCNYYQAPSIRPEDNEALGPRPEGAPVARRPATHEARSSLYLQYTVMSFTRRNKLLTRRHGHGCEPCTYVGQGAFKLFHGKPPN